MSMNLSCYDFLLEKTEDISEYRCLSFFGGIISKQVFLRDVDRLANVFLSLGLKPRDCFTIFLPTTPHAVVAFYALNKIGVVANIIHPLTPSELLRKNIEVTKSQGILILDILSDGYVDIINQLKLKVVVCKNSDYLPIYKKPFFKLYEFFKSFKRQSFLSPTLYAKALKTTGDLQAPELANKDELIATYMHSGGTTGEAKTIALSNSAYNSLVCNLFPVVAAINEGQEDSILALPLFHAYGLGAGLHLAMCKKMCLLLMPRFSAKVAVGLLENNNVSFMVGVPTMFSKMMQQKAFDGKHLQNFKCVYCGGDVVPSMLVKAFDERIRASGGGAHLFAGYGLTETCSVVAVNNNADYKLGSNGKPCGDNVIEVWNEKKEKLPPNTIGEFVVSGKTIMNGYLDGRENSGVYTDKNGVDWILTGDLGYLDEEGYLFFMNRKKRVVKIATFNIFPAQIENVVSELDFVKDACAVEAVSNGKPFIRLFITIKDGYEWSEEMRRLVDDHCHKYLIKHSCPKEIVVIENMPLTAMGKIDYLRLEKTK